MTNKEADQPVRCQKNEESLISMYRSRLTGSTGTSTGKKKALPVPSMIHTDHNYSKNSSFGIQSQSIFVC
jgi:hypothetical protein